MSAGIQHREGPYLHAAGCKTERTIEGKRYILVIAGAYDAGGMIGPEMNGIAVLNFTDRKVVLDAHLRSPNGGYFGPSSAQTEEFNRLRSLSDQEFLSFCTTHENYRPGTAGSQTTEEPAVRRTLMSMAREGVSYNSELKAAFAAEGRRMLTLLATDLNLPKGSFDLSFNPGGIAVSGDHRLHTDWFYLSFGDNYAYYRTCNGRSDFSGGQNRSFSLSDLYERRSDLVESIQALKPAEMAPS